MPACLPPPPPLYTYTRIYTRLVVTSRTREPLDSRENIRSPVSGGHPSPRCGCTVVAWYLEISRLKRAIDRISKGGRRQRGTPAKRLARLGVRSKPAGRPDQSTCIPPAQLRGQPLPAFQPTSRPHSAIILFHSPLCLPPPCLALSSSPCLLRAPVFVHPCVCVCVFNVRGEREGGEERKEISKDARRGRS